MQTLVSHWSSTMRLRTEELRDSDPRYKFNEGEWWSQNKHTARISFIITIDTLRTNIVLITGVCETRRNAFAWMFEQLSFPKRLAVLCKGMPQIYNLIIAQICNAT